MYMYKVELELIVGGGGWMTSKMAVNKKKRRMDCVHEKHQGMGRKGFSFPIWHPVYAYIYTECVCVCVFVCESVLPFCY